MELGKEEEKRGLLQYLMMGFLADQVARRDLVMPGGGKVDFRAACFCHRRVVDVGYVCSICLSSKFYHPSAPLSLCPKAAHSSTVIDQFENFCCDS